MDMNEIKENLARGMCAATAAPSERKNWSQDNPFVGQSDVVALYVQEYAGGEICLCKVGRQPHFVNMIDGKMVDLTASQFGDTKVKYKGLEFKTPVEILKNKDVRSRFMKLKDNVGFKY